jgi:GNAT superfamily N-acetyltransferase
MPSPLTFRRVVDADHDACLELFDRFSERTRFYRYHSGTPRISRRHLRVLLHSDGIDHQAWLAEADGRPIAVAHWFRHPEDPEAAELALVVEDAWHGRGVGTRLLETVVLDAMDQGMVTFTAEVLAENRGIRVVLDRIFANVDVVADRGWQLELRCRAPRALVAPTAA